MPESQTVIAPSPPPPLPGALPQPAPRPAPGPWGFWATMGWMVLMLAAFLGSSIIAVLVFPLWLYLTSDLKNLPQILGNLPANGDLVWISGLYALPLTGAVLYLALLARRRYPWNSYLALVNLPSRKILPWLIVLIAYNVACTLITDWAGLEEVPTWMFEVYNSARFRPGFFIMIIFGIPLLEELIFRGFVFTGVQARLGPAAAIALTAIVWSSLHVQYQWYYILQVLGIGVILGLARWRTGSIYAPLILHFLNNAAASLQFLFYS